MFTLLENIIEKDEYQFQTPVKKSNFWKRVKRIQKRKLRVIESFDEVKIKLDFSMIDISSSTGQNESKLIQPTSSSNFASKFLR